MSSSSQQPSHPAFVDVGRYGRALRRFSVLVLLLVVLGAIAGYKLLPSTSYQATASVRVGNGTTSLATGNGSSGGITPNMSTEVQIVQSVGVVETAAAATPGNPSVSAFKLHGTATNPPASTTMDLGYTSRSATVAQAGAEAWAKTYLAQRRESLTSRLAAQKQRAVRQRDAALDRLTSAEQKLTEGTAVSTTPSPSTAALSARVQTLNAEFATAQSTVDSLSALDVDAGSLLGSPLLPKTTVGFSPLLGAALGAAAGAVVGLLVALLLERLSRRVRDAKDLARATPARVWGVVGTRRSSRQFDEADLEALAGRLRLAVRRDNVSRVLITGTSRSATPLVEALARALPRTGLTLVPERDDGRSLSVPSPGGETSVEVRDAAPVLADPRTSVLSADADLTLLVVEQKKTKTSDVSQSCDRLAADGGSLPGIVVMVSRRRLSRAKSDRDRSTTWDSQSPEEAERSSQVPTEPALLRSPADE